MTFNKTLKTALLSLSASGLVMLSFAANAQAQALPAAEGSYCGKDQAPKPGCALSTVCGSVHEHGHKVFGGDIAAYFAGRSFADVTCEIMTFNREVQYQCQDRFGAKHRGELVYASYPKSSHASAHYAVCKTLLNRYPTDEDCGEEKPDCEDKKPDCGDKKPDCEDKKPDCGDKKPDCGDKKPDCGDKKPDCGDKKKPDCDHQDPKCEKPKKPDCGDKKKPDCDHQDPKCEEPKDPGCDKPKKPDCGDKKKPDCDKKKPDCDKKKPDCEKGEDKPKNDSFQETCQSHHGRCTVAGRSFAGLGIHMSSLSKFTVNCQCNTGVNWGYSERSPYFETVGANEIQDVCEEEVRLCEQPLSGGQAAVFGLEEHPKRKSSARCAAAYGQCRVEADAAGNGHVSCQCFNPGAPSKSSMVYGMEPGVQGATDQCFAELEACEVEKDPCPGGCGKGGVGHPGNSMDCSMTAQSERGALGAMFTLFAGLVGFRRRRRS